MELHSTQTTPAPTCWPCHGTPLHPNHAGTDLLAMSWNSTPPKPRWHRLVGHVMELHSTQTTQAPTCWPCHGTPLHPNHAGTDLLAMSWNSTPPKPRRHRLVGHVMELHSTQTTPAPTCWPCHGTPLHPNHTGTDLLAMSLNSTPPKPRRHRLVGHVVELHSTQTTP